MSAEFDYDLTPDQWAALKAIRVPAAEGRPLAGSIVADLVALQLAETRDGHPVITPKGRSVLLRGSPRLWDVARLEAGISAAPHSAGAAIGISGCET